MPEQGRSAGRRHWGRRIREVEVCTVAAAALVGSRLAAADAYSIGQMPVEPWTSVRTR